MHNNLIAEAILEVVPFGTWAELDINDFPEVKAEVGRVFFKPESNSMTFIQVSDYVECFLKSELHVIYDDRWMMFDFLNESIMDTEHENIDRIVEVDERIVELNSGRNVPVITLSQLEAAYERAVKAHRLFIEYGLMEEKRESNQRPIPVIF